MKKLLILVLLAMVVSGCSFGNDVNTFMLTKDQMSYALYDTKGNDLTEFVYKEYEKIDDIGYFVVNKEDQKGLLSLKGKELIVPGEYKTLERIGNIFYGTKEVEETDEDDKTSVLFEVKLFNRANGALAVTISGDVKGEFVVKAGDQSGVIEKTSFKKDASMILGTGKGTHEVTVKAKNVSSSDGNSNKEIVLEGKIKVTDDGKQKSVYLQSMKEKTEEEKELDKYISSNLYVIDCNGEVLYSASEDTRIKNEGLPVVLSNDTYTVVSHTGSELYSGSDVVYYADSNGYGDIVGFKDKAVYYYLDAKDQETSKEMEITYTGSLAFLTGTSRYSVLYDKSAKVVVYIDMLNHKYVSMGLTVDNTYIDDSNNIIIESSRNKYIYNPVAIKIVEINSFYQNGSIYALKNDSIYGPHTLYKAGEQSGTVENCQLYPAAKLINSEYIPVYLQDEGYVYYDFSGNKIIETIYKEANPFDDCLTAVVNIDDKGYSLINTKGEVLTKEYYESIKYLSDGYYAIYNEVGMYGIIDSTGTIIFDIQFTGLSATPIINTEEKILMIMNKNGRSYVYDMKKEKNILFSAEGDMEYCGEGYFKTQYRYYDIHGEEIK